VGNGTKRRFGPNGRDGRVAHENPEAPIVWELRMRNIRTTTASLTPGGRMKLERYKTIAEYIGSKAGISVTENVARKWAGRGRDPLPIEHFSGRITADTQSLDAWIARQHGVPRRSTRKGK
jgi:hypothetical protein